MEQPPEPAFRSTSTYEASRIGAAAIYCSDGRLGDHFDDFLHEGLGLPRYDRLVVPGGPASLADHFSTWRERDLLLDHLRFLVDVHGLRRVVLIAHENCAFYTERLHQSRVELARRQQEDLEQALRRVRDQVPQLGTEAYFAQIDGESVLFRFVGRCESSSD